MGGRLPRSLVTFAATLLFASSALAAAPLPRPATVGFFALRLARNLGFEAKTAGEAQVLLSAAGVTFAGRLAEPLTEDEATRLLGDLGLETSPSADPDRILSQPFADRLAGIAARGFLATGGVPATEGTLPTSCQSLERSQCFQCCIASLGRLASVPQRMIDLCNSSCTTLGAPPSSTSQP